MNDLTPHDWIVFKNPGWGLDGHWFDREVREPRYDWLHRLLAEHYRPTGEFCHRYDGVVGEFWEPVLREGRQVISLFLPGS